MNRAVLLSLLCLITLVQIGFCASDTNVMDDIGFDRSFKYYSSGNENINMQTGNVIITIPVSPEFPGPEGSGLNLQLNAIYNSQSWKYKSNERDFWWPEERSGEIWTINRAPLVNYNEMYYSPLGFGWRLHLGRLFRKRTGTINCGREQFVYEDPSGASHEFGPYCDDHQQGEYAPDGTYWSLDNSNLLLQVKNYGQPDQQVFLYEPSGISRRFDNIVLRAPVLPNRCDNSFNDAFTEDEVLNVKEIISYDKQHRIQVFYHTEADLPQPPNNNKYHLFHGHVIDSIVDACGRQIEFHYKDTTFTLGNVTVTVPYYWKIDVPKFGTGTTSYCFDYNPAIEDIDPVLATLDEPTSDAQDPYDLAQGRLIEYGYTTADLRRANYERDNHCLGGIFLTGQLMLYSVYIPENYSHSFSYNSYGEIVDYNDPLDSTTSYGFRTLRVKSGGCIEDCSKQYERTTPSRFIHTKTWEVGLDEPFIWNYDFSCFPTASETSILNYSTHDITKDNDSRPYGNTLAMTGVRNPDGDETTYLWKNASFSCAGLDDPYGYNKPGMPPPDNNCPKQDNSYNGRLAKMISFKGWNFGRKKVQEIIYNNGYEVAPENEDYGDEYELACKGNARLFKINIREKVKETRHYSSTNQEDYIYTKVYTNYEHVEGCNAHVNRVESTVVESSGFEGKNLTTRYEYAPECVAVHNDWPEDTRFNIGFVKVQEVKEGNTVVSRTEYDLATYDDGEGGLFNKGRIGEKRMKLLEGADRHVRVGYTYDSSNQLDTETWYHAWSTPDAPGEPDMVYDYFYTHGSLAWKSINGLPLVDNTIDENTGLITSTRDPNGNETGYTYDNLQRMDRIAPHDYLNPDLKRHLTIIDYKESDGRTIKFMKTDTFEEEGFEYREVYLKNTLDKMGNPSFIEKRVYDEDGYFNHVRDNGLTIVKDSTYDWRGNENISHFPGTSTQIDKDYDCLGRIECHRKMIGDIPTKDFQYDVEGSYFKKTITDEEGIVRKYYTDLRGNLREVFVSQQPSASATYIYDALGNLTQVNHGGQTRSYWYNGLGQLRWSNEPETGQKYYHYYNCGKLACTSDSANVLSNGSKYYLYNHHNQLIEVGQYHNDTIQTVSLLSYNDDNVIIDDMQGVPHDFTVNNGNGKLTYRQDLNYVDGVEIGITHQIWSYNDYGQVSDEKLYVLSGGFESEFYHTHYTYNKWGNLSSSTYPSSGLIVNYENTDQVDSSRLPGDAITKITLTDYTFPDGERTVARDIQYTAHGSLKSIEFDNSASLENAFDLQNRIEYITARDSNLDEYMNHQYFYNKVDQITQIKDLNRQNSSKYFRYFPNGSLWCLDDSDDFELPLAEYHYDSTGNMTDRVFNGYAADLHQFTGVTYINNRISSECKFGVDEESFAYDANGNVTYNPLTQDSYYFDYDNRLLRVTDPDGLQRNYIYDGSGNRRLKKQNRTYELSFYDPSGNNLLEKLKYVIDDQQEMELIKNECFINLGKNNIAQIDIFEPVVTLEMTDEDNETRYIFGPENSLKATLHTSYAGASVEMQLWAIIQIGEAMWYLPSWASDYDFQTVTLEQGEQEFEILYFEELPQLDELLSITLWTALVVPDNPSLFGNLAMTEFSLSNETEEQRNDNRKKSYVRPGAIGDGDIDNPFGNIQDAIDFAVTQNPSATDRYLIKLFPGEYLLEENEIISISHAGIDLIGSGQNASVITGDSAWNCLAIDHGADSIIQNVKFECNVVCDNATPRFKNVHFINNGALAGIVASNGCHISAVNCLIANYFVGIALNNSSCEVRSCTIDDCWGPLKPEELPFDWPEEWSTGFAGGAVISYAEPSYSGDISISVEDSIISRNELGIVPADDTQVFVSYTDFWANDQDYFDWQSVSYPTHCFSLNPLYAEGLNHNYYLSAISAGQAENSPCINAGNPNQSLTQIISGTTRTDGLSDICASDIGYHGRRINKIVGMANINNDVFDLMDPKLAMSKADKTELSSTTNTSMKTSEVLSSGPVDLMLRVENPDGTFTFQSYFQSDCDYIPDQIISTPYDPIAASLSDLDGDGVVDLTLLNETGLEVYVNDKEGFLEYTGEKFKSLPNKVLSIDFNRDGIMDTLIATDYGVSVQLAVKPLVLNEYQLLNSGETKNMILFDFDGDGDDDLATVDAMGVVRFYENYRSNGFAEVGESVEVAGYGEMRIQDRNNDGLLDIVVEIAQDIWEIVHVGDTFGTQPARSSGKRGIRYALYDHLGSTKLLINDSCEVVWPVSGEAELNELTPFGQELKEMEGSEEASYNLNFTNKEFDRDIKLNYFGARYYQPEFPRFLSTDPVGGTPEQPISWNRYLYCRNDPINRFDPDGAVDGPISGLNIPTFEMKISDSWYDIFGIGGQCCFVQGAMNGITISSSPMLSGTISFSGLGGSSRETTSNPSEVTERKSSDASMGATKASNKTKPDPSATGDHTVIKGTLENIKGYTTFKKNPQNPKGFDVEKRVDLQGRPHFNKVTGQDVPCPHVHSKAIPGGVAPVEPADVPKRSQ